MRFFASIVAIHALSYVLTVPLFAKSACEATWYEPTLQSNTPLLDSHLWDSWITVRKGPDGNREIIRYVLTATKKLYMPWNAKVGSPAWLKAAQMDRHAHAYIRVFTSKDDGVTWLDQGRIGILGTTWTGSSIAHSDGSVTLFVTHATFKNGKPFQSTIRVETSDGIEVNSLTTLFTPQQLQHEAQRLSLPYDFLSDLNGTAPAARDFNPIKTSDQQWTGLLAAKIESKDGLRPSIARIESPTERFEQWELGQPLQLPPFKGDLLEFEVPNLIFDKERQRYFLQLSVTHELNGKLVRSTYILSASNLNEAFVVEKKISHHFYALSTVLLDEDTVAVQGFFTADHPNPEYALKPTALQVLPLKDYPHKLIDFEPL